MMKKSASRFLASLGILTQHDMAESIFPRHLTSCVSTQNTTLSFLTAIWLFLMLRSTICHPSSQVPVPQLAADSCSSKLSCWSCTVPAQELSVDVLLYSK